MTDKTDAWMPLWIGAYLADTQHLTRDEHGGYLLLLMAYWRARSALPDDDKRLASIVKASSPEWKRLRPTLAEFFTVDVGLWWHKRVEAEIENADKRKASAVLKAQAGGLALAKKRSESASSTAPSTASSIAGAVLGECPTPSPSSLRSEEKKSRKRSAPDEPCPDDVDDQTWSDWLTLRRTKKATVTLTVIAEARREAGKAGMTLGRFLAVWCIRGSQGLQAEWLTSKERDETTYQRTMREKYEVVAPKVAAKAPGSVRENPMDVIEGMSRELRLAS